MGSRDEILTEEEIKELHVVKEEFSNYVVLLKTLSERPQGKLFGGRRSSETNDKSFTGTENMAEAKRLLQDGYLDILPKMQKEIKGAKKITAKYCSAIEHPMPHNAVMGYIPNVPNALLNLPQSMITVDRTPMKRKTLHIVYSNTDNADKSTDYFIKAGTALLSAIDIIERSGIQTKIDLAFMNVWEGREELTIPTVCIKNYGERFSIQKVSFPLAHPSMFRRIGFKWLETSPDVKENGIQCGYGHSKEPNVLEDAWNRTCRKNPQEYFINVRWIASHNNSVKEILKKFEVI